MLDTIGSSMPSPVMSTVIVVVPAGSSLTESPGFSGLSGQSTFTLKAPVSWSGKYELPLHPANNMTGDITPGTIDPATRSGIPSGNSPVNRTSTNTSVTDAVASKNSMAAGNSTAARAVAAANGIENMRLPEVDELVLPNLQASAGANVSLNAKAGVSFQAGSETAAQFANLKQSVNASMGAGVSFDLESHFDAGFQMDADMSPGLNIGGSAAAESSISADVGVSADIEPGITFED